jgi:hypothetical protein
MPLWKKNTKTPSSTVAAGRNSFNSKGFKFEAQPRRTHSANAAAALSCKPLRSFVASFTA